MMETMVIFSLCSLIFLLYMAYRCFLIYRLRIEIINNITSINYKEVEKGRYDLIEKRYEAFETVTFNQMVYKFWLPFKAKYYYKDLWFLEEVVKSGRKNNVEGKK